MKTLIIGDSRLKGLDKVEIRSDEDIESEIKFHSISGGKIHDLKTYFKGREFKKLNKHRLLICVCIAINDIPEDIHGRTKQKVNKLFNEITEKFNNLIRAAKRRNKHNKVVLATIAPKDLAKTIAKYPAKCEQIDNLSFKYQRDFESFIDKINKEYIQKFNCHNTELHIPLHRPLRQHRRRTRVEFNHYHKLSDGLHLNRDLKKKWKKFLNNVIIKINSRH